jgi:hypothetical protein
MTRGTWILLAASMLGGCGAFPNACEAEFDDLCELCPKDDSTELLCKCMQEGVLTAADNDGFDNDKEAQQACDQIRFQYHYQGDEGIAACRSDRAYIKEWGVDACEAFPGFD